MIQLPIYDKQGKQVDTLAVDEASLGGEVRFALLKQAYVMFHANQRQGSARTKNRRLVEGSTRKLYRQKGTGNARAGSIRSVLRKGGGVKFGKTRTREEYHLDMPKKMRRLANRNALLAKLVDNEVKCVSDLSFAAPRTSEFRQMLEALGVNRSCLVAMDGANRGALLSARNVEDVDTVRVEQMNAFDLLNHRFLVIDKGSLQAFLSGTAWSETAAAPAPAKKAAAGKVKA